MQPYLSNNSNADFPILARETKFSLDENFPSSLALATFLALTVPNVGIAERGGLFQHLLLLDLIQLFL